MSHKIFIFVVIPVVGDASRPSVEGLTHTFGIAGLTIKLWDVDFIIDSTFLLIPPPPYRGVGDPDGATTASSFRTTVTGLALRPLLAPSSSTTSLAILLLRSCNLSGGSFIFSGVQGSSYCVSWRERSLSQHINHSLGSSPSNGGCGQWNEGLSRGGEITPHVSLSP